MTSNERNAAVTYDSVIRGGTLVHPRRGEYPATLGISAGRIAAIAEPDAELTGRDQVDARDLHIFPGVIEPHAHWCLGRGLRDFETEARSAAVGGVTTTLLFLRHKDPYDALFEEYREAGEQLSVIDFAFHAVIMTEEHLAEVDHYADDLGITSFKFYMTFRGDDARVMSVDGIDDGLMLDCFEAVARDPKRLLIAHCENIEVVHRRRAQLQAAGRDDMEAWRESRPVLAEVDGIRRACVFAEETGCRLNVLHVTSAAGLTEIKSFRSRYREISAEVCHAYLALTGDAPISIEAKLKPPLRYEADREALWDGFARGDINTVGSDHVPRRRELKLGSVWRPETGCPGTATLLPFLLSEGHHKRGIPLTRIAEATSLNPAMLYGLYPRKGAIEIGADADLTFVDLDEVRTVHAADLLSHADYSLHEGWELRGWPVHTMIRGSWALHDGTVAGTPGIGEYVPR